MERRALQDPPFPEGKVRSSLILALDKPASASCWVVVLFQKEKFVAVWFSHWINLHLLRVGSLSCPFVFRSHTSWTTQPLRLVDFSITAHWIHIDTTNSAALHRCAVTKNIGEEQWSVDKAGIIIEFLHFNVFYRWWGWWGKPFSKQHPDRQHRAPLFLSCGSWIRRDPFIWMVKKNDK